MLPEITHLSHHLADSHQCCRGPLLICYEAAAVPQGACVAGQCTTLSLLHRTSKQHPEQHQCPWANQACTSSAAPKLPRKLFWRHSPHMAGQTDMTWHRPAWSAASHTTSLEHTPQRCVASALDTALLTSNFATLKRLRPRSPAAPPNWSNLATNFSACQHQQEQALLRP